MYFWRKKIVALNPKSRRLLWDDVAIAIRMHILSDFNLFRPTLSFSCRTFRCCWWWWWWRWCLFVLFIADGYETITSSYQQWGHKVFEIYLHTFQKTCTKWYQLHVWQSEKKQQQHIGVHNTIDNNLSALTHNIINKVKQTNITQLKKPITDAHTQTHIENEKPLPLPLLLLSNGKR